ncbi:hypothetical protein AURDEDRAFT_177490, partial [Auricularia subglabra TFB-10046 SS5]
MGDGPNAAYASEATCNHVRYFDRNALQPGRINTRPTSGSCTTATRSQVVQPKPQPRRHDLDAKDLSVTDNEYGVRPQYDLDANDVPVKENATSVVASARQLHPLRHASRGTPSIPELALGLTGDPRALWFFDGVRGTLGFVLPEPVVVDTVRINGHLSHGPARRCLPRDLVIWGAILPSQSDNLTWSMFDWPNTPLPQELAGPAHPGLARAGTFAVPPEVVWIPLTQLHDVSRSSDRDFAITGASVGIGIPVYAVTV